MFFFKYFVVFFLFTFAFHLCRRTDFLTGKVLFSLQLLSRLWISVHKGISQLGNALASFFRAGELKRLQWEQWWEGQETHLCACGPFHTSLALFLVCLCRACSSLVLPEPELSVKKSSFSSIFQSFGTAVAVRCRVFGEFTASWWMSSIPWPRWVRFERGGKESTFLRGWWTAARCVLLANCPAAAGSCSDKAGH